MKPFCFVLMPFGRKTDAGGRLIDFDDVYARLIAPAVAEAGLDGIRADEERVGGTIHKPMFERLMLCDYAIADLTAANPNVFYELGIRHALRPRSTLPLFAEGTTLPFDVAQLRASSYRLDAAGRPEDAEAAAHGLARRLRDLRDEHGDDSPLFQLIQDMPRVTVDHEKTDLFRLRADLSRGFREKLEAARREGRAAVLALAADPALAEVGDADAGMVVGLYLAYRDVQAYDEMVALYERMSPPLQRARMVREQLGFALNRLGQRDRAERVLQAVLADHGPSSETYGLLGRIHKDRWQEAVAANESDRARGEHRRAVAAYLAGFETDWRDAYPGVNALTLMELGDRPDPRQAEIAPVVLYAATRKARGPRADYWDHATRLEIAVLARDEAAAGDALADALATAKAAWETASTARNLGLIAGKAAADGRPADVVERCRKELLAWRPPG